MNKPFKTVVTFAFAVACAATYAGVESQVLKCPHAHIRSVLGLTDAVLADTNRFPLGGHGHYGEFTLSKPLYGFDKAEIEMDEIGSTGNKNSTKPHQLRSVNFRRVLSPESDEKTLVQEAQKLADEIFALLDIEKSEIRLRDLEMSNQRWWQDQNKTNFGFDLADGQQIDIRLDEAIYVLRNGRPQILQPASITLHITYNRELATANHCSDMYVRHTWGEKSASTGKSAKPELELDLGEDCVETISLRMKSSGRGIPGACVPKRRKK